MRQNESNLLRETLEMLRARGEVPYAQFVGELESAGKLDHIRALPQLYIAGKTAQRLVKQDGELVLLVSVKGA